MKNFLKFLSKNKIILYVISASQEIFLNNKLNQRITWLMAPAEMKLNIWLNYTVWVRKKYDRSTICALKLSTHMKHCVGVLIYYSTLPPDLLGKEWYNSEQSQPHIIMNMQTGGKPVQYTGQRQSTYLNNCRNVISLLVKG